MSRSILSASGSLCPCCERILGERQNFEMHERERDGERLGEEHHHPGTSIQPAVAHEEEGCSR